MRVREEGFERWKVESAAVAAAIAAICGGGGGGDVYGAVDGGYGCCAVWIWGLREENYTPPFWVERNFKIS